MIGLLYSIISYVGFLAVYVYFALFSDGVLVPKTADSGTFDGLASALLVDVALLLLWGIQHSVMARAGFKRLLVTIVPGELERATYVLTSSVMLAVLMWQWRPIPGTVWQVDNSAVAVVLWTLGGLGWLGVPLCSFMIDHFNLFGITQAFRRFRKQTLGAKGFVTPLLYKYVRHPMMTSFLVAFWLTPSMTFGHLLLSLGMSLYIMVGVHFEERALRAELGRDYLRYQASTPKFFPGLPETGPTARDSRGTT